LLLVLAWSSSGYAWSGDLLLNGGFEDGNDHWGSWTYWDEPDPYPSASAVMSDAHSGSWSMRVGTATGGRSQTVVKPRAGATYKVGAWGKVSTSGEVGWVGIEAYDIYGTKTQAAVEFTSTSYEYKEVQFTAPSSVDAMRVWAWKNDGPGYLYADDIVLQGPDLTYSPGGTTYYVDSVTGSDGYLGTSPSAAWETLDKVNSVVFAAGDQILLKAGCAWTGKVDPYGSGADGNPIIVDMYGSGAKPLIDGQGLVPAPFRLYNQEHWEVSNLELTNYHPSHVTTRYGAFVAAEDFGVLRHLHVKDLYVHDVNGLNDDGNKANGGVIYELRGLGIETWWDDVLIEGCTIERVDRSGIWVHSWSWDRSYPVGEGPYWVPSYNVVIRGNFVDDVAGDGIVPCECVAPLVEYNVVKDCNKRSGRYCVAIWPWNCDDAVFQYNEAYLARTTRDGEGFDSDWFSTNTIIQYNYSHDNEGGFCLVCANGTYENNGIHGYNDGTIVRYNISQNDQTRAFHIAGPCTNTHIYNNTIYIGEGLAGDPIVHSSWGGYADNTHFYNNIFYNLGTGDYDFAGSTNNDFDSNVFYGNHPVGEPADANKITAEPRLAAPGSGSIGRDSCDGYTLLPDSPCIDSGLTISDSGGMDYWGNPVPSGISADRGAHEYRQFPDVPSGHWAFVEIGFCVLAEVVYGYLDGLYGPGNAVTRDQMAVYISRALAGGDEDVPDFTDTPTFPDVPEGFWALDHVEYAVSQNVVEGYEDGTYHPEFDVTRDQMAVYVVRALVAPTGEAALADYIPADPRNFPDVPDTFWAYRHVEYCVESNVVQGYEDGYYHPEIVVTRDQMAVYICRAFDLPTYPGPPRERHFACRESDPLAAGLECPFDQVDLLDLPTLADEDLHDVEPSQPFAAFAGGDIDRCRGPDAALLPRRHCLPRLSKLVRATGLHLDEAQGALALGDDVHLAARCPEVPLQHAVAAGGEVACRMLLADDGQLALRLRLALPPPQHALSPGRGRSRPWRPR
jgi:hypothetical protein